MSDLVRVERKGRVTTVILNRPASRNAVNGPTAAALCAAFEQFDRDDAASVAVLWGAGGTFCAGADLKAFGTPEANSVHRTGPGPMGPSRMMLSKPVIAAVSGYAVAGGWNWRCGATCGWPRKTPCSVCFAVAGGTAHRRRHRATATADRAQPRDGHDPHWPWGAGRRSAGHGVGQSGGAQGSSPTGG